MKFACQLEAYQLPEWKGHYFPYDFFKRRLQEISAGACAAAAAQLQRASSSPRALSPGALSFRGSVSSEASSEDPHTAMQLWWQCAEKEAVRIGARVDQRHRELLEQWRNLAEMHCEHGGVEELRLLEGLQRVAHGLTRLQSFAELNHAALYKIAKKFDKLQGSSSGLTVQLPRLVQASGLDDTQRFESLEAQIRGSMLKCSKCEGLEASPRVALYVACLSRSHAQVGSVGTDPTFLRAERMLFFFLGCCMTLFLTIVILISLPDVQPETFDSAYFLSSFAVFRVVWSVMLLFWCMGTVARVCEGNFINHTFILSVDPRCRVGPSYLFGKAALLTSLWILALGMYVLDYKWMLLPTVAQKRVSLYRSSWRFVLYPSAILGLMLLMLLWPSSVCRGRYKLGLLGSVGRTCLAPLFTVSFCDNLVGDVMTSLAKPLEDIPAAICYLASHHPQLPEAVQSFIESGDTCPRWVHFSVAPVIAGAPFVFRLLQCARRYRDTRECKHIWNLGKYASSILVVVVGRTWKKGTVVVAASLLATAYAATWDVSMDWGLDFAFLSGACRRRRAGAPTPPVDAPGGVANGAAGVPSEPPLGAAQTSKNCEHSDGNGIGAHSGLALSLLGFEDSGPHCEASTAVGAADLCAAPTAVAPSDSASSRPVAESSAAPAAAASMGCGTTEGHQVPKRHFGPKTYCIAACLDVAMRMTWVLTLVPISLLSDDIVQRAVLQTSIATVEILRRSMWTVLRIEYEQVSNASRFRVLHWVPLQMGPMREQPFPSAEMGCLPAVGPRSPGITR